MLTGKIIIGRCFSWVCELVLFYFYHKCSVKTNKVYPNPWNPKAKLKEKSQKAHENFQVSDSLTDQATALYSIGNRDSKYHFSGNTYLLHLKLYLILYIAFNV